MWKKIAIVLLIIIVVCSVIELLMCQAYYNTYIDLDGIEKISRYETDEGSVLISTKKFKTLPRNYYSISPTTIIGNHIESSIFDVVSCIKNMNGRTFLTDGIGIVYPIFELIKSPKYSIPTSNLYFASNNPYLKIIMVKKHGKEHFFVH